MDRFVLRGHAAAAETAARRRRERPPAASHQRQLRIDDLRATVVLPTSSLHPDPQELRRLARVCRDPQATEREASRALLALGAYDVCARDLAASGGAVAAAVRWRRAHGVGSGPAAPGGAATRSPALAAALLGKWRARVLDDARRARRAARRSRGSLRGFVVAGGGGGGGGAQAAAAGGQGGAAGAGTGLEDEEDADEDADETGEEEEEEEG
jgi:hypothetical protein